MVVAMMLIPACTFFVDRNVWSLNLAMPKSATCIMQHHMMPQLVHHIQTNNQTKKLQSVVSLAATAPIPILTLTLANLDPDPTLLNLAPANLDVPPGIQQYVLRLEVPVHHVGVHVGQRTRQLQAKMHHLEEGRRVVGGGTRAMGMVRVSTRNTITHTQQGTPWVRGGNTVCARVGVCVCPHARTTGLCPTHPSQADPAPPLPYLDRPLPPPYPTQPDPCPCPLLPGLISPPLPCQTPAPPTLPLTCWSPVLYTPAPLGLVVAQLFSPLW